MFRRGAVAAALLVLAAGCAAERPGGTAAPPSVTTPPSASEPGSTPSAPPGTGDPRPPTMGPPSGPPKTPSDPYPVAVLVGRIVSGGKGPCYGLETDDGVVYAVHSTTAGTLATGTTVRVYTAPARHALDCRPGRPVDATKIEVVR